MTIMLATMSAACFAQNSVPEHTPFDSYIKVADRIFVYDKSLFSTYVGPDVSHWQLLYKDTDPIYDRKRLGVVSLTPTIRVYVDLIWDPMSQYYELRDVSSSKLIQKFEYYGGVWGMLLFSGQGVVYEFRQPGELCWGTTTNKYIYADGRFNEVPQPLHYLNNAESHLLEDVQLFYEPKISSLKVAALTKGTKVTVLSVDKISKVEYWSLIKTPLGLTGWVDRGLDIFLCN
jgi:hypothetical protein